MRLHWSATYVGIPYAKLGRSYHGCDCWGLVWMVQQLEFGRAVPSYSGAYVSPDEAREVTALIAREQADRTVWEKVETPADGDILIFSRPGGVPHAAVFIGGSKMLHMARETAACIEPIDAPQWAKRLTGIYRWKSRP